MALMGVEGDLASSTEIELDSMVNIHRYGEAEIVLSKTGTKFGAGQLLADGYPSNAAIDIMSCTLIDETPS